MDHLPIRTTADDLAEVLRLATLAFDDSVQGTGSAYEARMRPILDDLFEQVHRLIEERTDRLAVHSQ
ncbi:hypothetical protein CHE218_28270 [Microbacterium sp. che218]